MYIIGILLLGILPFLMEENYFGTWTRSNEEEIIDVDTIAIVRNTSTTATTTSTRNGSTSISSINSFSMVDKNNPLRQDGHGFSHCFYREYKKPGIHSGLPFVGEVFASHDRSVVYLAAENRKYCQKHYDRAHDFFANETHQVRFRCIFESDGSRTLSHPVHKRAPVRWGASFVLVQCPIPKHLRESLPLSGARTTKVHLTLESMMDLETGISYPESTTTPSRDAAKPNQLVHLPICSHAWPSETFQEQYRKGANRKYQIALMTRIAVSYTRGTDFQQLSVTHQDFVLWIEYHYAIGIEHFYIYDDSVDPHNSTIRAWCEPYSERGIVTVIFYPYEDVVCDEDNDKKEARERYAFGLARKQMYAGQVLSSNAALRRYENETEWMAHWDVDEYLTVKGVSDTASLQAFLREHGSKKDEIGFQRPVCGVCANETGIEPATSRAKTLPFESKRCCRRDRVPKGIYRTSTILHFRVHRGHVRMDNGMVRRKQIPFELGHIAHFRVGKAAGTHFPIHVDAFAQWVTPMKERIKIMLKETSNTTMAITGLPR